MPPSASRQTWKHSAVVAIGVGRHEDGRDGITTGVSLASSRRGSRRIRPLKRLTAKKFLGSSEIHLWFIAVCQHGDVVPTYRDRKKGVYPRRERAVDVSEREYAQLEAAPSMGRMSRMRRMLPGRSTSSRTR